MKWQARQPQEDRVHQLAAAGLPPLLARVLAARGVDPTYLEENSLNALPSFASLKGIGDAARLLADAIQNGLKIVIVADYDADGATACAVAIRALRTMGAKVSFVVPDRLKLGYGLSPGVVELAMLQQPDVLLTVDNGIASIEGVEAANRLGLCTIVTDHHLPGDRLPAAAAIVNPNQPGCDEFPSKALAGVGVIFYVMLALRAELRLRGHFSDKPEPNLGTLLDLVALGTVADVVPLDRVNRILVRAGLARIKAGQCVAGITALYGIAGRDPSKAVSSDLGFLLGPRINAAGRLADMSLGIECLTTDDTGKALQYANTLHELNQERRAVEQTMKDEAMEVLQLGQIGDRYAISLFDEAWHPGVVGIVASRVKDYYHRPTIVFAPGTDENEIRGSGRSIPGFHLRDALDLVTKRHPGLILKFGGHAAAAGLTIGKADLARFEAAFNEVASELIAPEQLELVMKHDGEPGAAELTEETVAALDDGIWGQGFPEPMFSGQFAVLKQRVLKEKHLKLRLSLHGVEFDAILFGRADFLPDYISVLYRPTINDWNGKRTVQIDIRYLAC